MTRYRLKAVILAGGKGEELAPLTLTRPKPMLKILGKPILYYLIKELRDIGIKDIVIVIGYKGDQIRSYFGSGSDYGVSITYVDQGEKQGIDIAILAVESIIKSDEKFVLLFGDVVSEQGLILRTLNALENTQSDLSMALTLRGDTSDLGIVEIDDSGLVQRIDVPKDDTISNYVDAGCFILQGDIIGDIKTTGKLAISLNNKISSGVKIAAAIWEKEWIDIGKPWNILEANKLMLSQLNESRIAKTAVIEPNVVLKGVVIIEDNAVISSGTVLNGPIHIGKNTFVGNNVLIRDHSSINENSLIGFGSEIKNSVLYDKTKVYRLCYIGDSVVGEGTVFSTGVMTVNTQTPRDTIKMEVKDRYIDTGYEKLGAIIGDNCELGVNTLIFPGQKIDPGSIILPGTTIKKEN